MLKAIDRHVRDVGSREPRMRRLKELQEHYALVTKPKAHPYQGCANIKTPTVTAPVLQISARLFDMVWPTSGKVFNVVAGTTDDLKWMHASEAFGNSYVRYNIPYMGTSLADTLHQKCLYGSAFRRTHWDAYTRKVRSDRVSIDDFVVPYAERSSDPSMADVSHYTLVLHMTYDEILDFAEDKLFVNVDKIKRSDRGDTAPSAFAEATQKIDGVSPSDDEEDGERQVLEHHCRWKLPNAPDVHPAFDGKVHYVYVVVDVASEQVLRMCLREEEDPDDKRRFERESRKYEQYLDQMRAFQAAQQLKAQAALTAMTAPPVPGALDATAAPVPGAMDATAPGAALAPAPAAGPPVPAAPPPTVLPPAPVRKRQVCFFTHYRCFQGEGFYGLGYGDMLLGLAVAINTLLNQTADGGALRNSKPAFMSRQVRIPRGSHNVKPGEFIEVDGPINEIQKAIMFLDPPQNDPTTVPLIKMLDAMKDSMVGNADLMSGEVPGSNQTKAGMQILAEQMMMPISVLARQTREEFRHELDKIWRCLGVFLEDDEIQEFLNVETGQPQQMPIGRWMFTPTMHLIPASDPRAKSQRVEDHQRLFSYVMNNPFVIQGPAAPAIMRALTEEGFKIFPDGDKLIPLLPPPQPVNPPPPPPKPQWAENASFLRGQDSPVHPDDNDEEHMSDLMMFLQSPAAQMMDKTGRDMAERHLRAHQAQAIEKKGAALERAKQNALAGPSGIGPSPMAGGAGFPAPGQVAPGAA